VFRLIAKVADTDANILILAKTAPAKSSRHGPRTDNLHAADPFSARSIWGL